MDLFDTFVTYLRDSGFGQFHWSNALMLCVGALFIYLALKKGFEPLLLVPIGFGILMGNIPYDASRLSLGVYDGPVSEADIAYYAVAPGEASDGVGLRERIEDPVAGLEEVRAGRAVMVNTHDPLTPRVRIDKPGIYVYGQGRSIVVVDPAAERHPQLWSEAQQDIKNASVLWWLFAGVGLAGFYPPLIFLGIGALTDFGPMLSNPKTLLLGAAAQFGIFSALLGAELVGFTPRQAASIGIIGGADGPTAIFTCTKLAPELLGAVALAAYSYMALVPLILPPVIRLCTTRAERLIRMPEMKPVSRAVRVIFPVAGFVLTAFIAPAALPLLGMLFFGNLLRESLVTDRLAKTAQTAFIDIVTVLLGVTVGAKTSAANFLTWQTIGVFALGVVAFALAAAGGVMMAKLMNLFSKEKVNPMIGAAGVSAVPMSARVVHKMGQQEDPQNYLLMHAMGPNVAGVIGSAVAAGVLLSALSD